MSLSYSKEYLIDTVKELLKSGIETEYLEFKTNKYIPDDIGEYISALSNSAAILGRTTAYMIWGIDDSTHEFIGTDFIPSKEKVGNEELENWLHKFLSPKINFYFHELEINSVKIVLLEIEAAFRHPVKFQSNSYIRIGSYKKKLKDFPEKERKLWVILNDNHFEQEFALENVEEGQILELLDYPAYFSLTKQTVPSGRQGIIEAFLSEEIIKKNETGRWNITNFGAILLAKSLHDFPKLKNKNLRIISYKDNTKNNTNKEKVISKGYAVGFEEAINYIKDILPSNEVIETALRKEVPVYPIIAIRELVANLLIHQDFHLRGSSPMIEIFSNRMEITNPGIPLVNTERFLDSPPKSRNESIASFMRRIGICEERGSGIDKVVYHIESYQLPAPQFEKTDEHTRVILFAHKDLKKMDKNERVKACYMHACLKHVEREYLTNTSIRKRFGIEEQNMAIASRIIKETVDSGLIRLFDESAAPKLRKYIPYWA